MEGTFCLLFLPCSVFTDDVLTFLVNFHPPLTPEILIFSSNTLLLPKKKKKLLLAIKFAITNNFLVIKIAIKMYQGPNNYVILKVYYMCILLLCYKVSDSINKK